MLRLLVLVPCERLIVERETNHFSLIQILEKAYVPLPAGVPVPEGLIIPFRWFLYCQWNTESDDRGREFEQRIEVITPDGEAPLQDVVRFRITERMHHVSSQIDLLPVSYPGDLRIKVSWRAVEATDWEVGGEYPLEIIHNEVTMFPLEPVRVDDAGLDEEG